MTADEIINYYLQNSRSTLTTTNTPSLCPAIIKSWICIDIDSKAVIRGQIHNHPEYSSEKSSKTSPIEGYCSYSGRIYVSTNNSMYELGTPHQDFADDPLLLLSNPEMPSEELTYLR